MGQNASLHLNYGDPGNKVTSKNRESCQERSSKSRWELTRPLRSFNVLPAMLLQKHTLIRKCPIANTFLAPWHHIPQRRLFFSPHIHLIHLTLDINHRVIHLAPVPNYAPFGGYPPQRPGYTPNAGYPSYQGYVSPPPYAPIAPPYPGYNGYGQPMYGYPWQPPLPKRDAYLLAMGITSLVGSILVLLAGLGAIVLLALISVLPHTTLNASEYFASIMLFISFACAGVIGGGFGLYHSIRSVFLRKPSADFSMPQFWIFFVLYLAVVGVAYWLQI